MASSTTVSISSPSSTQPSSPYSLLNGITESASTEFVVDDAELLSILASDNNATVDCSTSDVTATPTIALLDWSEWKQQDKKRKRDSTPLESEDDGEEDEDDDDDEDEYNFLDQFDFVEVSFDQGDSKVMDDKNTQKKRKMTSFVTENIDELSSLLTQSDSLLDDLDYRWVLDITS